MKRRYVSQLFAEGGSDAGASGTQGSGATAPQGTGSASGTATPNPVGSGSEKKYTDADVDNIINAKFARWQKEQEKKISEAEKLAGMNAQQKAEHERDELQKKYDELLAKNTRAEMVSTARKMLSEDSVNVPDVLIEGIVAADAETTTKNVRAFSKAFKQAVQDALKSTLGGTPKKGASRGTITKEEILKVKDPLERQRLIKENMNLFKSK